MTAPATSAVDARSGRLRRRAFGAGGLGVAAAALWRPGRALAQEATPVLVCSTGRDAVWTARLKDSGAQRVALPAAGSLVGLNVSPASGWVAHEAERAEGRGSASVYDTFVWHVDRPAEQRRLSASADVHWSPDGRRIALLRNATHGLTTSGELTVVERSTGDTRSLPDQAPDPTRLEGTYSWAPDSQRLAYIGDDAGRTVPKVWNVDARTVEVPPLAGALAQHGLEGTFWNAPSWSPDGGTLGIQAVRPAGDVGQVQVLLQAPGAVRALAPIQLQAPIPGSAVGAPLGWLPSGDAVLVLTIDRELGSVVVQRLSDGQWQPWLPGDAPHAFSERRFGRVAYATPLGQWQGDAWQVWLADADGTNPTPLARWLPREGEAYPSPAFAFVPGQALLAVSDRQGVRLLGLDGSAQGLIAVPGTVSSISWLSGV